MSFMQWVSKFQKTITLSMHVQIHYHPVLAFISFLNCSRLIKDNASRLKTFPIPVGSMDHEEGGNGLNEQIDCLCPIVKSMRCPLT